jgi:L,D-peptidoglycan transpeptidase YkuD (ErfK/YbiS/YcfS/YnhG family)
MRCLHRYLPRVGSGVVLLAAWLAGGCTSFDHDWEKAGHQPAPPGGLQGRWDGTWLSDANGHDGRLRCIVTQKDDGSYRARFHAIYRKVIGFGYTVPLKVEETNATFHFTGEANLGWWAGGVYTYEGQAGQTNFFSTYSCKYDHGTFQMAPVRESGGTNGAMPKKEALGRVSQLLVVTTEDWNAVPGVLRRFERANAQAPWTEVSNAIPIVVGRNGLGWGSGLNEPVHLPGPIKKEGDGKSPAGIFRLGYAFGLAEPTQTPSIRLPYQPLSAMIECVDDVKSVHYNSIVDRSKQDKVDWNSSEKMREIGEQYRLGVVVDHNVDPRVAGGGSCIFIHIWKDAQTGTSGCTAMAAEQIDGLVAWLDPAAHPALVQLPRAEYLKLQQEWELPPL